MTVEIPEFALAEGRVKALFVPTVASMTSPDASTVTADGVDISCFLMPDWAGPSAAQNLGDSRRFCSRQTFQTGGRITWSIAPLSYTYLPQELGTPGHAGNEVYEALMAGNTGVVIIGYDLDPAVDFAAGDVADLFPVECLAQSKPAAGSDEFAPLIVTQTLGVSGPVALDSVFVA